MSEESSISQEDLLTNLRNKFPNHSIITKLVHPWPDPIFEATIHTGDKANPQTFSGHGHANRFTLPYDRSHLPVELAETSAVARAARLALAEHKVSKVELIKQPQAKKVDQPSSPEPESSYSPPPEKKQYNNSTTNPASEKQLKLVDDLRKKANLTSGEFLSLIQSKFSKNNRQELTSKEASTLIEHFNSKH